LGFATKHLASDICGAASALLLGGGNIIETRSVPGISLRSIAVGKKWSHGSWNLNRI
jgi:hypothetical protein